MKSSPLLSVKPQLPGSSNRARSRSIRAFFAFDTDQSCQKPKKSTAPKESSISTTP
jgi:hypothetical protein